MSRAEDPMSNNRLEEAGQTCSFVGVYKDPYGNENPAQQIPKLREQFSDSLILRSISVILDEELEDRNSFSSKESKSLESRILEALGKAADEGLISPQIHSVVPGNWEEIKAELERMTEEKLLLSGPDEKFGTPYPNYRLNRD